MFSDCLISGMPSLRVLIMKNITLHTPHSCVIYSQITQRTADLCLYLSLPSPPLTVRDLLHCHPLYSDLHFLSDVLLLSPD